MTLIYQGSIYHRRLVPVEHAFTYPVFFFAFDLDRIKETKLFHHNRRGILALWDRDHLDDAPGTLALKCRQRFGADIHRITMISVPRVFGYVFNPVSFYVGYDSHQKPIAAMAEVNNTFHERHIYISREPATQPDGEIHFTTKKSFHVSPFNDRLGDYLFRLKAAGERFEMHVDIVRGGEVVFRSGMVGTKALPLSDRNIASCLMRYPFQNVLTLPRIHAQAARLYFVKKLRYYPKPAPCSDMTIKIAPPNLIERVGIKVFRTLLSRLTKGQLTLTMPDGTTSRHGIAAPGLDAEVNITDYTFFRRILFDGDIGLGEAYMYGQWTSPDLTRFIAYLIANREHLENGEFWTTKIKWLVNRLGHLKRSNTRSKSPDNIGAHYDLSNAFFALFLDPTMMYSAAVFTSPDESLEAAQHRRMKMLIDKLAVSPEHHILEIGSGWGGFAIELARLTGCRVTSITISNEQLKLARERVRAAGLQDRVNIEFCDYRDVQGAFDRIVSIEMLEAVGHEHFDAYFAAIERTLKPGGRVVIQVITIPEERYEAYRRSVDWIQKYIFPGGLVPSIGALQASMSRVSQLKIVAMEDIGLHYATTLRRWREALAAQRTQLEAMGYDDIFYRTWEYYFSYCEAAFSTQTLGDHHLIIER